jgi:hypothetical protein
MNDGAGGAPPAQPPAVDRHARAVDSAARRGSREESGFVVGGAPPLPARRTATERVASDSNRLARPRGTAFRWAVGLVLVTAVVSTAVFAWRAVRNGSIAEARKAVAQITVADGTVANGFLVEIDDRLWFATQFFAIEDLDRLDASFRDVESGAVLVELLGLPVERFVCHPRFFETSSFEDWQRRFETVACDVTDHRERLERAGVRPLRVGGLSATVAGDRLVCYAHERSVDLGERGREDDRAIAGLAVHTVRAGDVVRVRRESGLPATIETTIDSRGGAIGAPLLDAPAGEVVAVSYLPAWDDVTRSYRANAATATDASILLELVADGHPLSKVRTELESAAVRPGWRAGSVVVGGEAEKSWPTFLEVDRALARLVQDGWVFSGSFVVDCAAESDARVPVQVRGSRGGPSEVMLVAFSEERLVDLDIGEVEFMGLRGIGEDVESIAGVWAEVVLTDPTTGQLLVVPPGAGFTVPLRAYFTGRPIAARCSLVLLERAPGSGTGSRTPSAQPATPPTPPSSGPPAQPSASPPSSSPSPPPGSPSAPPSGPSPAQPSGPSPAPGGAPTPAAPAPATPASAPSSQSPSQGSRAGLAASAEALSLMIDDLFASSLIGMREFDRRYMSYPWASGGLDALRRDFVDRPVVLGGVHPDLIRDIMEVSLEAPLLDTRPVSEILLTGVPDGTALAVYLEVDPAWRHVVSLAGNGLVTPRTDMRVGPAVAPSEGAYDPASGGTRIALDIPWNIEGLRALTTAIEVPYALRVVYEDGSEDRVAARWRINPVSEVELHYPFELGFATVVDETHPWVKRLIEEIQNDPRVRAAGMVLAGAGGDQQAQLASLALVWRELMLRGLRYQSLTAAAAGAQRCRLVHESLSGAMANCIDGAVLFASLAQAMGIESHLVFVPGHALLACELKGRFLFIETTALSDAVQSNPPTSYDDLFEPMRRSHPFLRSAEVDCFESACESGWIVYQHFIEQARLVYTQHYARYRMLRTQNAGATPEIAALRAQLSVQARIVPLDAARRAMVRPVGVPTDLDARFKMAPRLRN